MKKGVWLIGLILMGVVGYAVYFLNAAMPTATGYTAKYICSQVFLADRDPDLVFENDIKPTNPLFAMVKNNIDRQNKTVTSKGFGFLQPMTAVYRDGCGCTLAVDSSREDLLEQGAPQGFHDAAEIFGRTLTSTESTASATSTGGRAATIASFTSAW